MLKRITSWSFRHRRLVVAAVARRPGRRSTSRRWRSAARTSRSSSRRARTPRPPSTCSTSGSPPRPATPSRSSSTTTAGVTSQRPRRGRAAGRQVRALPHVVAVVAPWDPAGSRQVSADGTTATPSSSSTPRARGSRSTSPTEMIDLAAEARAAGVAGRARRAGDRQRPVQQHRRRRTRAARRRAHPADRVRLAGRDGAAAGHRAVRRRRRPGRRASCSPTSSTCPSGPARSRP